MLARLQRVTTLGLLALAAAWAALAWRAGHASWALVGALLIAVRLRPRAGDRVRAAARMRTATTRHRAPHRAQLLRAWWGEVGAAPLVFCWRQPFRSRRWPDHLPARRDGPARRAAGARLRLQPRLLEPVAASACARAACPSSRSTSSRCSARSTTTRRSSTPPCSGCSSATGLAPLIVAHSMGGLAVRALAGPSATATRACTTSSRSAHRTTAPGWRASRLRPTARQMRSGQPWLRALAAARAAPALARFTCFYSHCDNIVFPPSTATLPGADNRHLPGVAHVHLAQQPRAVSRKLLRRLRSNACARRRELALASASPRRPRSPACRARRA